MKKLKCAVCSKPINGEEILQTEAGRVCEDCYEKKVAKIQAK